MTKPSNLFHSFVVLGLKPDGQLCLLEGDGSCTITKTGERQRYRPTVVHHCSSHAPLHPPGTCEPGQTVRLPPQLPLVRLAVAVVECCAALSNPVQEGTTRKLESILPTQVASNDNICAIAVLPSIWRRNHFSRDLERPICASVVLHRVDRQDSRHDSRPSHAYNKPQVICSTIIPI